MLACCMTGTIRERREGGKTLYKNLIKFVQRGANTQNKKKKEGRANVCPMKFSRSTLVGCALAHYICVGYIYIDI